MPEVLVPTAAGSLEAIFESSDVERSAPVRAWLRGYLTGADYYGDLSRRRGGHWNHLSESPIVAAGVGGATLGRKGETVR
jgi:hypothetical protein